MDTSGKASQNTGPSQPGKPLSINDYASKGILPDRSDDDRYIGVRCVFGEGKKVEDVVKKRLRIPALTKSDMASLSLQEKKIISLGRTALKLYGERKSETMLNDMLQQGDITRTFIGLDAESVRPKLMKDFGGVFFDEAVAKAILANFQDVGADSKTDTNTSIQITDGNFTMVNKVGRSPQGDKGSAVVSTSATAATTEKLVDSIVSSNPYGALAGKDSTVCNEEKVDEVAKGLAPEVLPGEVAGIKTLAFSKKKLLYPVGTTCYKVTDDGNLFEYGNRVGGGTFVPMYKDRHIYATSKTLGVPNNMIHSFLPPCANLVWRLGKVLLYGRDQGGRFSPLVVSYNKDDDDITYKMYNEGHGPILIDAPDIVRENHSNSNPADNGGTVSNPALPPGCSTFRTLNNVVKYGNVVNGVFVPEEVSPVHSESQVQASQQSNNSQQGDNVSPEAQKSLHVSTPRNEHGNSLSELDISDVASSHSSSGDASDSSTSESDPKRQRLVRTKNKKRVRATPSPEFSINLTTVLNIDDDVVKRDHEHGVNTIKESCSKVVNGVMESDDFLSSLNVALEMMSRSFTSLYEGYRALQEKAANLEANQPSWENGRGVRKKRKKSATACCKGVDTASIEKIVTSTLVKAGIIDPKGKPRTQITQNATQQAPPQSTVQRSQPSGYYSAQGPRSNPYADTSYGSIQPTSYAGAAAFGAFPPLPPPSAKVTVKPKTDGSAVNVIADIRSQFPDCASTGAKNVRVLRGGAVEIQVSSQSEAQKLVENLNGESLVASIRDKINPQIVIHGVTLDVTEEMVAEAIQQETGTRAIRISEANYKKVNANEKMVFVELEPLAWQQLTSSGYLLLSWKNCRVADNIPLQKCTNCLKIGHRAKFCKFPKIAPRSGICWNCSEYNRTTKNYTLGLLPIDHDTHAACCPLFRKHIINVQSNINYG